VVPDQVTNKAWSIPDVLIGALTSMCVLASWAVFRFVVPQFGSMYAELGGELPVGTQFLLSLTGQMLIPGAYTAFAALAFLLRQFHGISTGRIAMLLALVGGVGLLATTTALLYMPVWSIAGQIK
jgi:hypothetical protein